MINLENNEHLSKNNKLVLGQAPGLYDSVNTPHPYLFNLYKKQKAMDWTETEVDLTESKMDMEKAPKAIKDIMVLNLAYQWEIDSIASREFAVLLAPFITNSEFWASILKNQEIEVLHALTYSEIVRNCIPDTDEVFKMVMENENIISRSEKTIAVLEDLKIAGAKYTLGMVSKDDRELQKTLLLGLVAMYVLERFNFMSSFATTFACPEQGYFIAIGRLVQRIALDELEIHSETIKYVIQTIINDSDTFFPEIFKESEEEIRTILQEALTAEYEWADYIFSEGRTMVGLNSTLLKEYVDWNMAFVEYNLKLPGSKLPGKLPLPFMKNWLNLDSTQAAPQEEDHTNYLKNAVDNDIPDNEEFDF